ncbi:uncharacterized protein [Eurosta solidaginis]|uniref:uncharacterized protein isoform X1 n=1 Tax=Eurosta solidaginis TaxID=178769 RepID=UPI0035313432
MFKCFACNFSGHNPKLLVHHLKSFHVCSKIKNFICTIPECGQYFSNMYSFQNHLNRVHLPVYTKSAQDCITNNSSCKIYQNNHIISSLQNNTLQHIVSSVIVNDQINKLNSLQSNRVPNMNFNQFVLSLHNKNNFTRKDVFSIVQDMHEIILKPIQEHVLKFMAHYIEDHNNRINAENNFQNIFSNFQNITKEYRFFKLLEREKIFAPPTAYIINEEISEIIVNNNPGLHSNKVTGVLMPIEFQIKKYFETKNNLYLTLENIKIIQSKQDVYANVINGETWKQKMLSFKNKLVIPYVLYFDEFGIGNPLGSHACNQSVCGIYYNFPTIPNHHLSTLENIFVAGFFKSHDRKECGNIYSFKPLIKVIQHLEAEGIVLTTAEGEFHVFFVLALITGDNLGLNSILGFTSSFNSNFYCRNCKRHKSNMQSDISEHTEFLRNRQSYISDCAIQDFKLTAITETCIFNDITSFHIVDNFYFYLMHDLFEGVCHYDISEVLLNFIETKKYFSLETFNYRKQIFSYGPTEIGNSSPPISLNNLRNSKFKISAREMMCFVHHLPFIISDLVPEGDEVWNFFLVFLQIIDILLLLEIGECSLNTLKSLIEKHHYLYKSLFKKPLKPKFHFLLHYVSSIKKCGPLKKIWCMRFEAVHKIFKTYSNSITSRVNIPWSLSIKAALKFSYNISNETFF